MIFAKIIKIFVFMEVNINKKHMLIVIFKLICLIDHAKGWVMKLNV